MHFELASTFILTTREAFRRGCLRREAAEAEALQAGWLAAPLGAVVALLFALLCRLALAQVDAPYRQALYVYCLAAFLELLAEPLHLAASRRGGLRLRLAVARARRAH